MIIENVKMNYENEINNINKIINEFNKEILNEDYVLFENNIISYDCKKWINKKK
jgi:hypothetical protein